MPNPMLNARTLREMGLGRNHNYQSIYEPDPEGKEASENARVWRVYLDEAGAYDADMIDSFRTILDSLLIFASLFSAVVTTFVAQTSQVLQPNDAQTTVSLLIEIKQLLRAAGNTTTIDSVRTSILGLDSTTYTSKDLWVNGLFFTSLTLSVTTALLTVLAKQWIQAYIEVVSGDARTQTILRQFRFQGLARWKLGSIIEGLPLILHGSVAMFLVGLSLYVSQISTPICAMISLITALTFVSYLASSAIPVFSIDCPFRRLLQKAWRYPLEPLPQTLKEDEYEQATHDSGVWNSLLWLLLHSTNNSTKDITVEGVSGLLDSFNKPRKHSTNISTNDEGVLGSLDFLKKTREHDALSLPVPQKVLWHVLIYCTNRSEGIDERVEIHTNWNPLITKLLLTRSRLDLTFPYSDIPRDSSVPYNWYWFSAHIWKLYVAAHREEKPAISQSCLSLMLDARAYMQSSIWSYLYSCGSQEDICCATKKDTRDLVWGHDSSGATLLHHAAGEGNLQLVIALVDSSPQMVNIQRLDSQTALYCAIDTSTNALLQNSFEVLNPETVKSLTRWVINETFDYRIVEYLLDHGASAPPSTLHFAASRGNRVVIQLLLDRGWDRSTKDESGALPVDLARIQKLKDYCPERFEKVIEYLEHYQTVALPPKILATLPTITSEPNITMSSGQVTSVDNQVSVEAGSSSVEIQVIPCNRGTDEVECSGLKG
ncbi:hypothetical protein H0H93_008281 [Arthromyces matolae]|nr:hypothetical protein H0H93_008281 [Arthromyces matolae]